MMKRKVRAGDLNQGPFNTPFTDQERKVLRSIDDVKTQIESLKAALRRLPVHACAPPERYKPDRMEEFEDIEQAIHSLELHLRWIPGGAYRFGNDEPLP